MLVKFTCGCIGILGIQGDPEDRPVLVYPCDLNGEDCWEPLGLQRREMHDKGYESVSNEKATELIGELGRLVGDGYRFRRVRTLLTGT